MIIRVLFTVSILGLASAQDDRLINVKQIMRDTFDILKNLPPPSNLNQVSKVMFPTTTLPPVYYNNNNPPNPPQLTPDEYQALLAARTNRPLTIQQRSILFNLNQKINAQKQYTQTQGGQYNQNQYYQGVPQNQQQQPAIMNPINRIFATPTEKDMERLLRLPADILYKIAEEGHYIDPEDDSQGYSHSKTMSEIDRPLPAGVSSSDSSNPGLFGNGFSFNVGNDNAGQITNPFLTKEDVKKVESTPQPKSQQETITPSKISENKEPSASQTPTKEITYQNSGDKVDKTKPYFVVNNGEWQLVVPQPDDKPALQIPVKDFTKLTEAVARASARSGMPVDMAKMVAAEELHVKAVEATTASSVVVSTTVAEAQKKIEKTPASAFIQESESIKSEEEEKAPASTPKTTTTEEEVITLNGKIYRLVKEEKPKKKKTKKTKKSQTTGQNTPSQASSTVAPTTHAPMSSTTLPPQAAGVPVVAPLNPVQLPGVNQPFMPSMLSQYQQQQLTYEQQQILAELQQRYLQSQAMMTRQQSNAQIPYVQNYNAPQLQSAAISAAAQQMSQPYYQKVSAPATLPQIPSVTNEIPMKVQHNPTQAVVSKAAAAPVKIVKETPHHIDPYQSSLPKQKIYSLQELDQFYNMRNSEATTEAPVKETTTEKVYAPHRQIKIKMNSDNEAPIDENEQISKTTVVDATADAIDEEKKRIAELRRRFALERQQLSRRNRAKFEKTTNLEPTTPPSFTITEQHCYNIKNFAKQAGSSNVYEYAISHCHYIENYYPDLTCANVEEYIKVCQRYYATRRMLFS